MLLEIDLPSPKLEEWRWADLAGIEEARHIERFVGTVDSGLFLPVEGPRLVFVDGYFAEEFSDTCGFDWENGEIGSEHALGHAASGDGAVFRFASRSASPLIQILHVTVGGENHAPARWHLEEDAAVSVVETYAGAGWTNALTSISLARGARLMRSVRLMQTDGFVSLRDEAEIGEAASLVSVFLGVGGAGSRIDGSLTLAGKGGFAEMGGALLTRGAQKQECAVVVRHEAVEGTSRQLWRAVAADQSTASLAARVEVAQGAQQTDGEQSLRGLLLKRTATINLKPELEIFADDVKCAHGATVGELDRAALFYLQSRGIPEARATALLTRAFVADALARIGDEAVRAAFETDADAWLEAAL